jgi:pimeloyl-ACP methyl ester carboxylesterase
MYEAVLTALSERQIGAVAFDLPGYGQSLRPSMHWGPAETAACLSAGLLNLTTDTVAVAGGHLSANVAIEWALGSPKQISHLVLDGVYAPTPEEASMLLAPYRGLTPRLQDDRSHETFIWRATCEFLHEWNPKFKLSEQTMPEFYDAMSDYLQMGYESIRGWLEPGNEPPALYDAIKRVEDVAIPLLVLTAEFDALRPAFNRVLRVQPLASNYDFPGAHPLNEPERASEYAGVLEYFLRSNCNNASILRTNAEPCS